MLNSIRYVRYVWNKQCFDSHICFLPQVKILLKDLFCWLNSIELLSILLGACLKKVQLPKHCLYDTSANTVRYLRYVFCQRLRCLWWEEVSCLKQNYMWFFFLTWCIWRPIGKTKDSICQTNILMSPLTHCIFAGLEFLLMVIFLADLICVLPNCIILLSSRRIYLPLFILEVTKQCVALWFYKFQYRKFCSNFSAENQEKFRFEKWTIITTATDIDDPNGYTVIPRLTSDPANEFFG